MAIQPQQKRYLKILIIVLVIWLGVIPFTLVIINAIVASNGKTGPERTTVPQLVGLNQKTADAKARRAKLSMQVMMTRSDQSGPPGIILFQTPGAGESVEVGTVVGVSMGVDDPDTQSWEDRRRKLQAANPNK
jgi:beta-lactam-binding protein with PASTA domain